MDKEAVGISFAIAWLLNQLLGFFDIFIEAPIVEGGVEFIIALGMAFLARRAVFSRSTLRNAGLDPQEVAFKAETRSLR